MRKRIPNGKINKTDLALYIHDILDIPLDPIRSEPTIGLKIVDAILQSMKKTLQRGEYIHVRGFGKFTVKKPREFWNVPRPVEYNPTGDPKTTVLGDEQIFVPAKKRVYFKPSVQLTAMLNIDNPSPREKRKAISKW